MKKLLPLLLLLTIWSCSTEEENVHTYWVNSYTVPCEGMASMQCLLIQKNDELDPSGWQNFYGSIKGFVFEPQFITQLKVREIPKDPANTPADASSIDYEVVKVVSKERDTRFRINDIWVAIAIDEAAFDVPEGAEAPYIEVNLRQHRIIGTDGCNRFNGSIETLTPNSIELGPLAQTKRACMDIAYPDQFMSAFNASKNFRFENGLLIMMEGDKERIRFKKID